MTTDTNRRNLLAILGIGAAGAALNPETIAHASSPEINESTRNHPFPNLMKTGMDAQRAIADALVRLADEIRTGKDMAVTSLKTTCELRPDNWVGHQIILDVELLQHTPDDKTS